MIGTPLHFKMCLRVRACGQLKGQGSHVSVFIHLMRGENDDFLGVAILWECCSRTRESTKRWMAFEKDNFI